MIQQHACKCRTGEHKSNMIYSLLTDHRQLRIALTAIGKTHTCDIWCAGASSNRTVPKAELLGKIIALLATRRSSSRVQRHVGVCTMIRVSLHELSRPYNRTARSYHRHARSVILTYSSKKLFLHSSVKVTLAARGRGDAT